MRSWGRSVALASTHLEAKGVHLQVNAAQDIRSGSVRRQSHNVAAAYAQSSPENNQEIGCSDHNPAFEVRPIWQLANDPQQHHSAISIWELTKC